MYPTQNMFTGIRIKKETIFGLNSVFKMNEIKFILNNEWQKVEQIIRTVSLN